MLEKSFMTSILGSGSTKPFSFLKLHHFYSNKNMLTAMKWSSLQSRASNFTQKSKFSVRSSRLIVKKLILINFSSFSTAKFTF